MKILLLLLVTATAGLAQTGQAGTVVYRCVDKAGQVQYGDQFVEGCEKLEMPDYPVPVRLAVRARSGEAPLAEIPEEPVYKSLKIASPKEDEALRRQGDIPFKVLVNIDPAPQRRKLLQEKGHRLVVSVDGESRGFDTELQDGSLALLLTDVFRGTHQLQVMIKDEKGKNLVASQVVNFHVQQISSIILRQQRQQLRKRLQAPTSPPEG